MKANAFILVFSPTDPDSYNFVTQRCIPDVNDDHFSKVLVGSFAYVRNESYNNDRKQTHITTKIGEQLAYQINATAFFEYSIKNGKGLNKIFEEAVRATSYIHQSLWILPRQTTLCFNISFFFDSESSSLYEHFEVDERSNAIGQRLNGHQKIEKKTTSFYVF